jgi:hypothetical protein
VSVSQSFPAEVLDEKLEKKQFVFNLQKKSSFQVMDG